MENKFHVYTLKQLLEMKIPTNTLLWEPFLPKVGLGILYGSSDIGKSTLLRQLCLHIASKQTEFLNSKLAPVRGRAIYVSTEDGKIAMRNSMDKQVKTEQKKHWENLYFLEYEGNLVECLDVQLAKTPVDLIVIDAWADTYSGSMNEANRVRENLSEYNKLSEKYKCLILLIHHLGKRTEALDPDKNNVLGSQAIEAKSRIVLELRADRNNPSFRYLTPVKGNYLSTKIKNTSIKLEFTEDMTFVNTGEVVEKSKLTTVSGKKFGFSREIKEKAHQFYLAGKSVRQIEEELAKLFTAAPKKSAIAEWVAEFKEFENEKNQLVDEAESTTNPNKTDQAENTSGAKQQEIWNEETNPGWDDLQI